MVGARTLFIMGGLVLYFQGHDVNHQGNTCTFNLITQHDNSRMIQATCTMLAPVICIMVGARVLFIMDDLEPDLQGHDDLESGLTGYVLRVMSIF